MSFLKKLWTDRVSENPTRRILRNVATNEEIIVDVARNEGEISQEGDAFSAENMNDLEQRIADEFNNVNSNLNGFSFTTQDNEDGYIKGGEFHPFGNPYLRYDEGTGYIEAIDENGNWIKIYETTQLPIKGNIMIYENGKWNYSINANCYESGKGLSGSYEEKSDYCLVNSPNAQYGSRYVMTTKAIDISQYNTVHFDIIIGSTNYYPTIDVSGLSGSYYIGFGIYTDYWVNHSNVCIASSMSTNLISVSKRYDFGDVYPIKCSKIWID